MSVTLGQMMSLVGRLDDSQGEDTPRERFRRFLGENVIEVGQVRDYVEECLRNQGEQYDKALQDMINHLGKFLGFNVTFGRYRGISGQSGFDGLWQSPTGFSVVTEAKTTEVFPAKTSVLLGYVDELISEKKIPDWDNAIGLYVIGRPDPEVHTIEDAIVAQKNTNRLRIVSVESLLSLAETMSEYDVSHSDVLAMLRPSGPRIDPIAELMGRLIAPPEPTNGPDVEPPIPSAEVAYWVTPVASDDEETAEEVIKKLVGQEKIYAFSERTPGRRSLKPGDWMSFYESGKGVVAHARVTSKPERKPHPQVRQPEKFPWTFKLDSVRTHFDSPTVVDVSLRSQLDAFKGHDPSKAWGWFVVTTRTVNEHDYRLLVGGEKES